jgi:hypothetical protein
MFLIDNMLFASLCLTSLVVTYCARIANRGILVGREHLKALLAESAC